MAKKHESKWNIDDLTDAEIYAAIRYLDPNPKSGDKQNGVISATILILLLGFLAAFAALVNRLTHVGLSVYSAQQQALVRMYRFVIVQAQSLSYVEMYWVLAAVVSALMFVLFFLLAKNEPGADGEVQMQ
jgi:hypothetical protein